MSKTRLVEAARREPVVQFPHVCLFGFAAEMDERAAVERAGDWRKQLLTSGLVALDDVTAVVPATHVGNINMARKRRGRPVNSVFVVGSHAPLGGDSVEGIDRIVWSNGPETRNGDRVWKTGSSFMYSATRVRANLVRQKMTPEQHLDYDLAVAGALNRSVVRGHSAVEFATSVARYGRSNARVADIHRNPDGTVGWYRALVDTGDIFHPRSLVVIGGRALSGSGLMVPVKPKASS